ncbi:hypothetical protein [Burkholderia sp. Ac-20365]|uniref:hypothetical protein n=1 Tax=Burkholderia sp. Ac-20365 TaxID=2703897 RepID=UPI00197C2A1C|nr:hypothetical protein [Burkholderia sp. Ac-20365]MBN3761138.1 hypothetical protein [Burkholderia sp. Ac-20365]
MDRNEQSAIMPVPTNRASPQLRPTKFVTNALRFSQVGTPFFVALALATSAVHAREPTRADQAFCDHYAAIMQKALEVDRGGDPAAIARFRQSVARDPEAQLIMPGLGVSRTTPQWITDVTVQSREHCLDEVRLNMRGWLPDDPERPKDVSSASNHVGAITRLPSERAAQASATSVPPAADQFEGTFIEQNMYTPVKVIFRRHAGICFGGTLVTVPRHGMKPLQTCGVREQSGAYIVRFPQDSFGEVSVPFSTMRTADVDQTSN